MAHPAMMVSTGHTFGSDTRVTPPDDAYQRGVPWYLLVRDRRYKYIRPLVSDLEELYDLQRDPEELDNLAFKIDIHFPLRSQMQQTIPSIGPREVRDVALCYSLAREAFGSDTDIIVHCHSELDLARSTRVAEAVEPIKPLYFEDPLPPAYSDSWMALRRSTRLPLLTGEVLEMVEGFMPFIQNQAVDCLQPDLRYCGGISGANRIADLAAAYQISICLHNVNGYALNLASQQWSAAHFNCPPCGVAAALHQQVHDVPGLGIEFDHAYLKANLAPGEPWWG